MRTRPTYPGVYVEEISTSVRTITSVSTATAAFVGHTRRGPLDEPVRVTSFAEFERHFGGLTRHSAVSYAAHQFFTNGGSSAVIVRVIKGGSATAASVTLEAHEGLESRGVLVVRAKEPGSWGSGLRVVIDYGTRQPHETFNLHVVDVSTRVYESFPGLSMDPDHHRHVADVINSGSGLVSVEAIGDDRPDPSGTISKPFEHELPDLDDVVQVRIGEVEREFRLHDPGCDGPPPRHLGELAALLERKLRALPDVPGRQAFARAQVRVIGRRLQTVAGSLDEDDVVHFDGQCADDLGLEALANPPVFALSDGDDGDPPGPLDLVGSETTRTGLHALRDVEDVNLLNLPDLAGCPSIEDVRTVLAAADRLCREQRIFLLVDAPAAWTTVDEARRGIEELDEVRSDHAALYFPHLLLTDARTGQLRAVPPSGAVAGVIARTDAERGVWKAPAGTGARLAGVRALTVPLTDRESGLLNPMAVNCLRVFPSTGAVVWGARTLDGTELRTGEDVADCTYVPVRRLALHVEETLYRGLRWVVFEPNTEVLWRQIRLDVSAYLDTLFRRGAFAGRLPREAYFVKCDSETTTEADVAEGVVNVVVGIAPVDPAEFVIVNVRQQSGLFDR
jgi:uncharacterized protein